MIGIVAFLQLALAQSQLALIYPIENTIIVINSDSFQAEPPRTQGPSFDRRIAGSRNGVVLWVDQVDLGSGRFERYFEFGRVADSNYTKWHRERLPDWDVIAMALAPTMDKFCFVVQQCNIPAFVIVIERGGTVHEMKLPDEIGASICLQADWSDDGKWLAISPDISAEKGRRKCIVVNDDLTHPFPFEGSNATLTDAETLVAYTGSRSTKIQLDDNRATTSSEKLRRVDCVFSSVGEVGLQGADYQLFDFPGLLPWWGRVNAVDLKSGKVLFSAKVPSIRNLAIVGNPAESEMSEREQEGLSRFLHDAVFRLNAQLSQQRQ